MDAGTRNKAIGVTILIIGLVTLLMFGLELQDGVLRGSKSDGMTVRSNPATFYISVTLQFLIGAGMSWFGVYMLRKKD